MIFLPGYEIKEKIYEYASTLIYRGRTIAEQQPVIVKLLKAEYPTLEDIASLRHEYTIIKNIQCSGIIKAINLEKYQNSFALILEDCGGQTLSQLLDVSPLSLTEFFSIAIALADTLIYLHQIPIIHKDIKPSNIIINWTTNEVKLTDFGIASRLGEEKQTISNLDRLEGTLAYISPEQTGRMNRPIDYRSDFYSLGATFYEMLTQTLPFNATDPMELIHSHLAKQAIPPEELEEIPSMVSQIVMKLLAKNPEDRYQSARGLKFDLQTCQTQWEQTGTIQNFPIGSRDRPQQLFIPQKLYGRETQVATLMAAWKRVSQGESEISLITGYSGIGKTAIVQEVNQSIFAARGYFISGKFDQLQRNIPYSAIKKAFGKLIRQLLTESTAKIASWKEKLLNLLGANAQVIIELIPEVALIVGSKTALVQLGAIETQNRFNLVFQQFLSVFCQQKHPLVIFLDDLQWADSASLKLIELFTTNYNIKHLLFIGAYRDNEINSAHPLSYSLEKIKNAGKLITIIPVHPLANNNIIELLTDTLKGNIETKDFVLLAELLYNKTQGNPLFLREFIKIIYTERLLTYLVETDTWQWSLKKIQAIGIGDRNVVELIARNISKLPLPTQKVLQLAACIGNEFSLEILTIINGNSESATAEQLWTALQAGLILPLSNTYKIPLLFEESEATTWKLRDLKVNYGFLHDRVQQAAYSLIPEAQKKATHLRIGQLLLQNTTEPERKENIFALVNQLNFGIDLLRERLEKDELTQLNLIAGQKAKAATAYQAAVNYLNIALELMGTSSWQERYELTLAVYLEASEAQYLNINFSQAETLIEQTWKQVKTILERVKLFELKIKLALAQSQIQTALSLGLEALEMLGVSLYESSPQELDLEELAQLPLMCDPHKLAAMEILLLIQPASCIGDNPLALPIIYTLVELPRQYGNCSPAIFGYAMYGALICWLIPDIDLAYKLTKLALFLLSQLNAEVLKAKIYIVSAIISQPKKEHIKETIEPLRYSITNALEVGDIEYACHGVIFYCEHLFHLGEHLEYVKEQQSEYIKMVGKFKQEHQLYLTQICAQVVLNLLSYSQDRCRLMGETFNEEEIIPRCEEANNAIALFNIYCGKLLLCYLFKDYSQAIINGKKALKYQSFVQGQLIFVQYNFYYSLALLGGCRSSLTQRAEYLQQVEKNQEKLNSWAQYAPMNYLHKFYLVEAEKSTILGQTEKALSFYEQAIIGAREQGYLQEEALANELAGEFHLARGHENLARFYILEAYYAYIRWGAIAKVKDLESRYPKFFVHFTSQENRDISLVTLTTEENSHKLDWLTVFKASQAISQEIVISKLLSKLMKITIENAGAQKGLLILCRDNEMRIEASGVVESQEAIAIQSISVKDTQELPLSVINYVQQTQENVILQNASRQGMFTLDPYIKTYQVKSILCSPIIHQGKLLGILYLENNLTVGAFTSERLELLKILSSQAAISIDNALLYEQLKNYSYTLELKVSERTEALVKSNQELQRLANLDGLTGVANRRRFDEYLSQEWKRMAREQLPLSLILCDVDFFKLYNDYYGHIKGDECLQKIAKAIAFNIIKRPADLLARYGGEEFAIILPQTNLEGAIFVGEAIQDEIRSLKIPHAKSKISQWVTSSLGVSSIIPHPDLLPGILIQETDSALYQAKAQGRDRLYYEINHHLK